MNNLENTTEDKTNLLALMERAFNNKQFEMVLELYHFGLEGTPYEVVTFHEETREMVLLSQAVLSNPNPFEPMEDQKPKRRIGFRLE